MPVPELFINHQVITELLTGDEGREGMLLSVVLAMGSTPILAGLFLWHLWGEPGLPERAPLL